MVIIGGGPAGNAAAIGLAGRGLAVTVLEQGVFPRHKVCGEFISPAATDLLESLISRGELERLGAIRIARSVLEVGTLEAGWALPRPAWAVSRDVLDSALVRRAEMAGAVVRQGEAVRDVTYWDHGVRVRVAGGEELLAELVVHADGVGRHDPGGPVRARRGVIGIKCRLHPGAVSPVDAVVMRSAPGAYLGRVVTGTRGDGTLAATVRTELISRHAGDLDAVALELWPAFDRLVRRGRWYSCPVAESGFVPGGHPRSFRVGNAAGAVEPVGGEGIGLALWAGAQLGVTLDPNDLAGVHAKLASAYRARLRVRRPVCSLTAWFLMRPGLVRAAWPLLARPGLTRVTFRPWYRLSGKPV